MLAEYFTFSDLNISAANFKQQALVWASRHRLVAYYDNNNLNYPYGGFENLLAVSNRTDTLVEPAAAFNNLDRVMQRTGSLLCGFLSYDLKNQIEKLQSNHPDFIGFPLLYFFEPEVYLYFSEEGFKIYSAEATAADILGQILSCAFNNSDSPPIQIKQRVNQEKYLAIVRAIQKHILEGDVYEINYCHEFFSSKAHLNPVSTFWALNAASPMPFAGYFKLEDKYLLCASPERSLKKEGEKLISQPIKGTVKRSPDKNKDEALRMQLQHSEKEIAENMMIMDLVRNDLSKSSEVGSVQVEEMFGIYGFKNLYQMMTTVTSRIKQDFSPIEAIKNAFPMGSMTGAPKIRAMELIEQYESSRRGLFSGSIGYLKPTGDFDFNVVIRSIQYNASTGYLSFMVGSAITYDSDPEQEYAECLLKAETIINILNF